MVSDFPAFIQIQPYLQSYLWGMTGKDSWVARISRRQSENGHFAELWCGAHPNGPSTCLASPFEGKSLLEVLAMHPDEILGRTASRYSGAFPMLQKVLSVGEPLSIQVHPTVTDAERLHQSRPADYPDPYPKFEGSIAISETQLLFGMKPVSDALANLSTRKVLWELVSSREEEIRSLDSRSPQDAGRLLFETLWRTDPSKVTRITHQLFAQIEATPEAERTPEEAWVLKLKDSYPNGDVGLFGFYIMDLLTLKIGESVSIETGIPHAYLSGEVFEVMLPSDNVLRCGITPKKRDDEELFRCARFSPVAKPVISGKPCRIQKLSGCEYGFGSSIVAQVYSTPGVGYAQTNELPELLFCLDGEGSLLKPDGGAALSFSAGSAFVVPARTSEYRISLESGRIARFLLPVA